MRIRVSGSGAWLFLPSGTGALARLHQLLLRAAYAELRRRSLPAFAQGREQDDLAHQATTRCWRSPTNWTGSPGKAASRRERTSLPCWRCQPSLAAILACSPVPMCGDAWERIPDRFGADPAEHAESRELAAALRRAVTEVLSERQRRVFGALVVDGVPLDALAVELGSTRNARYKMMFDKMMFDARRKIRVHLVAHGYLDAEGGTP
jgi:RNA polymerase sigma-70 factor, ECF subfamily